MNIKEIKELAKILKENNLESVEVSDGQSTVKLKNACATAVAMPVSAQVAEVKADFAAPVKVDEDLIELTSPMVGVFYSAPAPDSEDFVKVGDKVKKGDVLCIVEAMKLMNEIAAEQDGEIVEICVLNAQVVEFGQTMFKMR